ncbi:MAG: hypothetical protein HY556_04855 [Euryarchaeota archaeon]|nr:hypothetical protein [Euryarchaeota archaeon]
MVNIPFIGKRSLGKKIEALDDLEVDLRVATNISGKQIERAEDDIRKLVRKGIGASKQQQRILAAQAKGKAQKIRILQSKLFRDLAVYTFVIQAKGSYEAMEMKDEGPLKNLQKIMKVATFPELQKVVAQLAKEEQKIDVSLQAMQQKIEEMQEEYASPEWGENSFMSIMESMEGLPEDQREKTIQEKIKFPGERA